MTTSESKSRPLADIEYLENQISQATPEELYENASYVYNLIARNIGKIKETPDDHLKHRYMTLANKILKYLPTDEAQTNQHSEASDNPFFIELRDQYARLTPSATKPIPQQTKPVVISTNESDNRLSTIEKALSQVLSYISMQDNTQKESHQRIMQEIQGLQNKVNKIETNFKKNIPQPILRHMIYSILTHCNLNCKGCQHFAPIVEKHFVSPDNISKDLRQLSKITDNTLTLLSIIGGEPLLHPDLIDICSTARKIFPDTKIEIVTNGILLPKQEDAFWISCAENTLEVAVTKYPINLDFKALEKKAKSFKVTYRYFSDTGTNNKTMYKDPKDLDGKQDPRSSFLNCAVSNNCTILRDGIIYPCAVIANSPYFNKKFGTNMRLDKKDYLDIHAIEDYDTLATFLSRPVPFCRYCKVDKITEGHPWELSKREITEWT